MFYLKLVELPVLRPEICKDIMQAMWGQSRRIEAIQKLKQVLHSITFLQISVKGIVEIYVPFLIKYICT